MRFSYGAWHVVLVSVLLWRTHAQLQLIFLTLIHHKTRALHDGSHKYARKAHISSAAAAVHASVADTHTHTRKTYHTSLRLHSAKRRRRVQTTRAFITHSVILALIIYHHTVCGVHSAKECVCISRPRRDNALYGYKGWRRQRLAAAAAASMSLLSAIWWRRRLLLQRYNDAVTTTTMHVASETR